MNNERTVAKPVVENRNYKDTLFRMIFRNPEALLSLYNAVNGTNYTNPGDLRDVTLENAIYMNMKNDLALIIDGHIHLYEHQSSVNMNMPLRDLIYIAEELNILASGVLPQLSVSSHFWISQFRLEQPLTTPSIHRSLYHF